MSEIENRVGTAQVGDITIAYEDMGNPDDPAVLLIMGLSAQLTFWQTAFCESIAEQGYRVIRFDNRDIGLSTHLDGVRVGGSMLTRMARHQLGLASDVPYTLVDMAQDAIGLLDTLDIEKAHVIGGSMGGMRRSSRADIPNGCCRWRSSSRAPTRHFCPLPTHANSGHCCRAPARARLVRPM
jgi:homoserine acetyltransferase